MKSKILVVLALIVGLIVGFSINYAHNQNAQFELGYQAGHTNATAAMWHEARMMGNAIYGPVLKPDGSVSHLAYSWKPHSGKVVDSKVRYYDNLKEQLQFKATTLAHDLQTKANSF